MKTLLKQSNEHMAYESPVFDLTFVSTELGFCLSTGEGVGETEDPIYPSAASLYFD